MFFTSLTLTPIPSAVQINARGYPRGVYVLQGHSEVGDVGNMQLKHVI